MVIFDSGETLNQMKTAVSLKFVTFLPIKPALFQSLFKWQTSVPVFVFLNSRFVCAHFSLLLFVVCVSCVCLNSFFFCLSFFSCFRYPVNILAVIVWFPLFDYVRHFCMCVQRLDCISRHYLCLCVRAVRLYTLKC